MKKIDLTGHKYGRVAVLSYFGHKNGRTAWNCLCDCGNTFVTTGDSLRTGKTSSCGCYRHEREIEANVKHGLHGTRLYKIYHHMKQRCYDSGNSRYKNYGGRGIKICQEWLSDFKNFYNWALENGYKENLSIERIDVNGNYCPENCKWIPMIEQYKNKTNNIIVEYKGEKKILSEWCKELNLRYSIVHRRLNDGWDVEKAFFKPTSKYKLYDYNGKKITTKDISKITGLTIKNIQLRFSRGWNIDKIINTPYNIRKTKIKEV